MARAAKQLASGVSYEREELRRVKPLYDKIDDALMGSEAIKARGIKYLPDPSNGADADRYTAYITRAVFYAVTRPTHTGMVGEIFNKDPTIVVPEQLKPVIEDASGEGVGIVQAAKALTGNVLALGRGGLFVDFPNTNGAVTRADLENMGVRPVIRHYHPKQIINWRHRKVGAAMVLSLVVLQEDADDEAADGFTLRKSKQWRVLRLDENGHYTVQLYTGGAAGASSIAGELTTPTDATGAPFTEIPFKFVGSETNDANVDYPPFYDIADLNIAHYRNSADNEESLFVSAQPTLVVTGLTEAWADKYFKTGFPLGSRAAIPLPEGATADLLEVQERSALQAQMEHKEKQMVALGAKIVEQRAVQRTATEASQDESRETSVLATVADNVSRAFEWALYFASKFAGLPETEIKFQLNKEFAIAFNTPEARREAIEAWIAGAISFTEMRTALRKGGTAILDDQKAREEIEADELRLSATNPPPVDDPEEDPETPDDPPGTTQE